MRHAKSDWSMGQDDHARPLNPRGDRAARALGDWLKSADIVPDQALVSDAVRTRETFARLNLGVTPDYLHALYLAAPDEMLRILSGAWGETVLMIGHNAGIADLASALVAQPPQHARFTDYPTGSTLVADFDIDAWSDIALKAGRATWFTTPRDLE